MAPLASRRTLRSASRSRTSASSSGICRESRSTLIRAQSSSNNRFQAALPTGLKSVSTLSSGSESWWGRNFRASSTMCRYFAYSGQEAAGGWVAGVLAVEQIRVDVRLGGELFVVLELAHHGGELFRRERDDLAFVALLERLGTLERFGQRGFDGRVGRGFEEVGQVPANAFGAGGFGRLCHGRSG